MRRRFCQTHCTTQCYSEQGHTRLRRQRHVHRPARETAHTHLVPAAAQHTRPTRNRIWVCTAPGAGCRAKHVRAMEAV